MALWTLGPIRVGGGEGQRRASASECNKYSLCPRLRRRWLAAGGCLLLGVPRFFSARPLATAPLFGPGRAHPALAQQRVTPPG